MLETLSRVQQTTLGPDHRETLLTRQQAAFFVGDSGEPTAALKLYQTVLLDQVRALGPDDRDTLLSRHQVAYYLSVTGDAAGALALYREVAADSERALGPDDRDALTSRHNVAYYERTAGDRGLAIEVDVLQRAEVLLSADDPLIDAARWLKRQLELTVAVASEGRLPRERRELNDAVDLHGSRPG